MWLKSKSSAQILLSNIKTVLNKEKWHHVDFKAFFAIIQLESQNGMSLVQGCFNCNICAFRDFPRQIRPADSGFPQMPWCVQNVLWRAMRKECYGLTYSVVRALLLEQNRIEESRGIKSHSRNLLVHTGYVWFSSLFQAKRTSDHFCLRALLLSPCKYERHMLIRAAPKRAMDATSFLLAGMHY
jgi:hypothetical protein